MSAVAGATIDRAIVFEQVSEYRRVSAHRCITSWPVLFAQVLVEVDFGLRMAGPVLFVALRFDAETFTPELQARFSELVEKCGGTELSELSTLERANFLTRLEQCVHRRLRLSLERVVPAFDSIFTIVDRVSAQQQEPERRAAARYPVTAEGTLRVGDAPPVEVQVQNLSSGGVFVSTRTPVPFAAPIKVELRLPVGVVTAEGTVANVSDHGVGIRFALEAACERGLVENLNAVAPAPAPPKDPLSVDALLEPADEPEEELATHGPLPRLGDYELLSVLGRGGKGEVYFARGVDGPRKGRFVAIKKLSPRLQSDTAAVSQLAAEGQTLALLDHPHIVKILEAGVFDGARCIVMEALDGRDLGQLVRRSRARRAPLPLDAACYAAKALLDALSAVHGATSRAGVRLELVHCDVSPHNLFVSRAGQLKLGDFGSARRAGERVKDPLVDGRPSYLSPEALDGVVNVQRDLWAAAVTAWELVTLELPFTAGALEELAGTIRSGPRKKLRAVRADASPGLELVLQRALHVDPAQRFQSAAEFSSAIAANFDGALGTSAALAAVVRGLFPERSWKAR